MSGYCSGCGNTICMCDYETPSQEINKMKQIQQSTHPLSDIYLQIDYLFRDSKRDHVLRGLMKDVKYYSGAEYIASEKKYRYDKLHVLLEAKIQTLTQEKQALEADNKRLRERADEAIAYFDCQGKNRTLTWEDATENLKELLTPPVEPTPKTE